MIHETLGSDPEAISDAKSLGKVGSNATGYNLNVYSYLNAMLLEAGLHVGQDDLPPRDARRLLGSDAAIGFSSHNMQQVCAAGGEPVDYVAFGPVFATASKRNPDPVTGIEALKECRSLVEKPLVAIGGITRETAGAVLAAGADSVAAIGDLLPAELTSISLRQRMEEWQRLVTKQKQA